MNTEKKIECIRTLQNAMGNVVYEMLRDENRRAINMIEDLISYAQTVRGALRRELKMDKRTESMG